MSSPAIILSGLVLVILALAAALVVQYRRNVRQEMLAKHLAQRLERLQLHFGRFTPEEVIEKLTDYEGTYEARMRTVTVLFADIKGFTKMCHKYDPDIVLGILNGYFRNMNRVLARHHGQVTELIGDGILSLFGALRANPWQAQDAVMAALEMRVALQEYNKELAKKSLPTLSFGIGIHHGEVLAGLMGDYELSKFGVVGDAINVASRIESLTRIHDVDLLISDKVREILDDRFILKEMTGVKVKGKPEPIVSYWVEGISETEK